MYFEAMKVANRSNMYWLLVRRVRDIICKFIKAYVTYSLSKIVNNIMPSMMSFNQCASANITKVYGPVCYSFMSIIWIFSGSS